MGHFSQWLSPNKQIPLESIHTLVFNRSDRLGDAVITLPFMVATIAHLRTLGWQGEVVIIASPLNEPILAPLGEIAGTTVIVHRSNQTYEYERSIIMVLWHILLFTRAHFKRVLDRSRNTTLLVDFVDSISELSFDLYSQYPKAYWISANRGIFTPFFDYTLFERFSGNTRLQLIDSCTLLME